MTETHSHDHDPKPKRVSILKEIFAIIFSIAIALLIFYTLGFKSTVRPYSCPEDLKNTRVVLQVALDDLDRCEAKAAEQICSSQ